MIALFDVSFILKADGTTLVSGSPQTSVQRVCTDSRAVQAGDLFVCIQGDRFDGHTYAEAAVRAGAVAILGETERLAKQALGTAAVIGVRAGAVESTLRALAHAWRKTFKIPVLAIAGAVGKTTTKEMLAAIFGAAYPGANAVLKTAGSENGFLGIPITLLKLRASHRVAIIEIGIDDIGAMQRHLDVIEPTAAIVTAIGPEHLEKLIDLPTVTREEGLALVYTHARAHPVVIVKDDPYLAPFAQKLSGPQTTTVSLSGSLALEHPGPSALVGHAAPSKIAGQTHQTLSLDGLTYGRQTLALSVPGAHNARNALGAIALAHSQNIAWSAVQSGLEGFIPAFGRSEISRYPNGTLIYRDYYNANPSSVHAALEALATLPRQGKLWLCLGDMLELGAREEALHRELASPIITSGASGVLLYGPRSKWLQNELKTRGFHAILEHFSDHTPLAEALCARLNPGDHVLIKGSRGMKMEEVWKKIEPTLVS